MSSIVELVKDLVEAVLPNWLTGIESAPNLIHSIGTQMEEAFSGILTSSLTWLIKATTDLQELILDLLA
jgi:phage-related protein